MNLELRQILPRTFFRCAQILCVALISVFLGGCAVIGVVGTAASLTYSTTKTTVGMAAKAAKWTHSGASNGIQKMTASASNPNEISEKQEETKP